MFLTRRYLILADRDSIGQNVVNQMRKRLKNCVEVYLPDSDIKELWMAHIEIATIESEKLLGGVEIV